MATVECGFPQAAVQGVSPADVLVRFGPTVYVNIQSFPPSATTSGTAQVPALIDTGATESSLDDVLAQELSLPIVDQGIVAGISGQRTVNIYLAQIVIPNLPLTIYGRFAGVHLQAGGQTHRALLGRTLLKHCQLNYDGPTASVKLSI